MTGSARTTATTEGPAWSAGASGWIEHWARFAAPAREAVARAAGIEAGASVLDVGCGSGEFCELAAARGAHVSGIDAICNWGRVSERDVHAIFEPLSELKPPRPGVPPYDPPRVGEPGVLEGLARQAGLTPQRADDVDVPYEFPDRATLERALLAIAPVPC
jgi:SAM-dependent methyltransferase